MPETKPNPPARLPATVWALGFVSLFMDISSEMAHALLPLFLTGALGASAVMVGLVEGVGAATGSMVKVFSGYFSDRLGRRKPLILLGYGLGALSKPLFAMAGSPLIVLAARFSDRIGKGVRGAPRDALIADVAPPAMRGRAFGLRQSLDTAGAVIGPLLAIGLLALFAGDMRAVFWIAVIPGAIAAALVLAAVREPPRDTATAARAPIRWADLRALPRAFWKVVLIGMVFMLARFSEAFLILKASAAGLPLALAPLVLMVMNIVYAMGAWPAGILSDRLPAARLLLISLFALCAADMLLATSSALPGVFAGVVLWGAHMALSQGLLSKLVADRAPTELRGSAFGLFNLFSGLALLCASLLAGLVWQWFGPASTFLTGAAIGLLAALLVLALLRPETG
ncbi:MAG: MFS transporter [Parvularculaceae bacterium]